MCGIAGALVSDGSDQRRRVEAQVATLGHRGPDSSGVYVRSGVAIGQTRLAVIDLVTGDPPITNEDGLIGVALNGEIYNFASLRSELLAQGHTFSTAGDTEVIAHLAEELDPCELAARLDGMFAFAIWDDRSERLVLGRDRLGKKPLYFWAGAGGVVFGSEIKAVVSDPAVPRRLDPDAIPAYLTFGYVPTPRTFYEGVQSLPPGHVLVAERGMPVRILEYWRPPVGGDNGDRAGGPGSLDEAGEELRRLLTASVAKRLVADVPVGAFLSGGIDSSAVVSLMAVLSTIPVRTFTIGFDDRDGYDERPFARQVAERFGTEHTEFVVQPDAVDLVERLVHHHDQPFGDASAIPTYLLSELTRQHVTVALCGDGGDELFAGYERFSAAVAMRQLQRLPVAVRQGLRAGAERTPGVQRARLVRRAARFVASGERPMPDYYRAWISYVPDDTVADLVVAPSSWGVDDYRQIWAGSAGAAFLDRLLDLNLRTYLLDDLLPKVDRMSMAHGLEVRTPFLDRDVVPFALALPPAMKLRGWSRKRVLKHAMRDLLTPEILNRPKRGFGVPLDRWFRTDLRPFVEARLIGPQARLNAHVRHEALQRLWQEHLQGAGNGLALWTLLTLEVFLEAQDW
jgi:asparagine synthase (glutamine-hydrolysing)